MSFYKTAELHLDKLESILTEEDMVLSVRETYPLTLIISRNQAPEAQMSFLDMNDGEGSALGFSLRFIFGIDGLEIQTSSRLHMTDEFLNKLKGLAKKWHAAYTHAFFAEHMTAERLDASGLLDDE